MLTKNLTSRLLPLFMVLLIAGLAGCNGETQVAERPPTDTLAPLVTLTERVTATPVISRTPLPTFTYTPSITPVPPTPTQTFTPTEIPPVMGIISSLSKVNVRNGPGGSYSAFVALDAGVEVEILGKNQEQTWLNIRLDDGREGWVSAALVRVEPSPTPFPTLTTPPDLTALFLGTPLPTAVIGGGTVTATPPRPLVTPTAENDSTDVSTAEATGATTTAEVEIDATAPVTLDVPVINTTAVFQTATALAGGIALVTPTAATSTGQPNAGIATPTGGAPAATAEPGSGNGSVQQGVDVLAYCDNPAFARPAPTNLAAGSTIDVFWGWYAKTQAQVQQHRDNAIYEVRLNGKLLENWDQYASTVRLEDDGNHHVYWYVPGEPLPAGVNTITYQVTWQAQITDGYDVFGPGTTRPSESGTCTFTVLP